MCRLWGIKRVFISGLVANFIGVAFFALTNVLVTSSAMVYLFVVAGMLSLGAAISSVATIIATYVVVEFPKYVAIGLILFYSCLNLGFQLSRPFFSYFSSVGAEGLYLIVLALVMLFFIIIIRAYFSPPEIPRHLDEYRDSARLWKDLNYRFGLFILAMVFYGMIESTFSVFGYRFLANTTSVNVADNAEFFFWLALNLGQIGIGIPAFWIRPSQVLKVLPLFIILALVLIPWQHLSAEFVLAFTIGGLGCSAVFPLLIAMIILDIRSLGVVKSSHESMIPYMEAACGYMVASYTLGLGIIALEMELMSQFEIEALLVNFRVGIGFALAVLGLVFYLARTSPQKAV
jgi:MFS family permease